MEPALKNLGEMSYWSRTYATEGKGCFTSDANLKSVHRRYCDSLDINTNTYVGKTIVDLGCGPRGTLHLFKAKTKYGIDPLAKGYDYIFRMAREQDMIYLSSDCENIPLLDRTVDAVLSVNSLDHVDNLEKSISEILRIVKPGGEIRMNLNLQPMARVTEPQVFTEKAILTRFKRLDPKVVKRFPATEAVPFERILVVATKP